MEKILCIGSVTTDVIVSPVKEIPPPGTLAAVGSTSVHVGGCASNASMALAKLGAPAALSCKVGTDNFGDFVCKEAAAVGVDISGVRRDPAVPTTSSVVCVSPEGERSFLYCPGSTAAFRREDVEGRLLKESGIVFVAGAMLLTAFDGAPCRALLDEARAMGKYTVMDTAWDFDGVWLPKIREALPGLDLFMPSYEEAARLSGKKELSEIAGFFLDMGVKNVVIKNGGKGAYFAPGSGERYELPTYTQFKPVDTTGAGDSFCAGFLCGLAMGWDFRRCGALANVVGTHCVRAIGANTGIPTLEEALDFLEKTPLPL